MRKKIIFIVCLCIFVIAFIIIILSSKQDLKAIVIEKDYSLTSTVDTIDQINVPILLNQKSSYFSDVNQIDKMTLSNLQEDDMMQAKIINISFSDEKIKIEDDNYYMAIYTCEIEFFPTEEMKWYFPEIYLNILYKNNVQAKLKIGEMTYNKVNSFNQEHLSLSTIRGTTSMINNNNMLDGMFLGFRNQTNNDITIKNIEIMDHNLYIGNEINQVKEYNEKLKGEDILQNNYSYLQPNDKDLSIHLSSKESKTYYFPILYDDYYITQSFALKLTYEYLGEERIAYLEPYLFFINHYETIDKEHLKIYQYTL